MKQNLMHHDELIFSEIFYDQQTLQSKFDYQIAFVCNIEKIAI